MKKIITIILITAIFFQCGSFCVHGDNENRLNSVTAKYAAVIEANSGSLIYGKAENVQASMASTTKIMTALLLCELCDLDKEITVTAEMVTVEGSSMGLKAGDRVHYRDLLYGMLLASGNDAANATAISIAGSISAFAELMNSRAERIGMHNTHFVTPSGLDDEKHYSTAFDMALLAREAMNNNDFATACSSKSARLEYGNPPYKRTLTNHNKLLKMYHGCIGVKTGFTKKSGRCLVSCAERDGKKIIAVTLNAPDDWNDHRTLLDYGFSKLETRTLAAPELDEIYTVGGLNDGITAEANDVSISLLSNDFNRIETKVILNDIIVAPQNSGDIIGVIKWELDGITVAESDITVSGSVINQAVSNRRSYLYWLEQFLTA